MILTRLGNKRGMSQLLYQQFPQHKLRIELFFGAGGSYFYLPKPQYSILNDLDNDVTNLYQVLISNRKELENQINLLPISESLVNYWKKNIELDPILKAIRFLFLSNFTYLGKGDTLRLGIDNTKKVLLNKIEPTLLHLTNSKITNCDFREVIDKISFSDSLTPKSKSFIYLDPVYLETEHYYKTPKWNVGDTEDCFKIMKSSGIKSAMSEFNHEAVLDFASDYKMNVIYLKERNNIKNRRQEVLITNYKSSQLEFNYHV